MRLSLWLLASIALMTGGCVLPCQPGACSVSGEPRYISPAARFFGTESPLRSMPCRAGACNPEPYLTLSKYWPFMDRWTSTAAAKKCAKRYLLRTQLHQRRWLSKHFKDGFVQAFVDIANGESGEVPPVPPPKYWNTHYRTDSGKQCVETWFDGYRSGSALAAGEFASLRTIGASYDWSIEKPRNEFCSTGPFISADCAPGGRLSSTGATFNSRMTPGPQGFQSPQPSTGLPANPIPMQQGFGSGPATGHGTVTSPGYGGPAGRYGVSPGLNAAPGENANAPMIAPTDPVSVQPAPGQPTISRPVPGLSAPSDLPMGAPSGGTGLLGPGYSSPGASPSPSVGSLPGTLPQPSAPPSNGVMTPGFSGLAGSQNPTGGQVSPGKLGPPPGFESDPPVFQVSPPQR